MPETPRILFMGTPVFAQIILETLLKAGHTTAVVTQPDKPAGRGQKLHPPPAAVFAKTRGLQLFQPEQLQGQEWLTQLKALRPDLICVAAYGKFIPKTTIEGARIDCLNVHPSMLPEYRGPAPIQQALLDGRKETGVSIMRVTGKMDAGPVFLQEKIPILDEDNAITLDHKLAKLGGGLLLTVIKERHNLTPREQDEKKATFTTKLSRALAPIDWSQKSGQIFNKIRALLPWPVASTVLNNQVLKIYSCEKLPRERSEKKPGSVAHIGRQGLTVATADFNLLLKEVQLAGKKKMNAFDLMNGLKIEAEKVVLK